MEKHQLQFDMRVYNDLKIKMAWQSFFNIVVVIFNIQLSLFIVVFNLNLICLAKTSEMFPANTSTTGGTLMWMCLTNNV